MKENSSKCGSKKISKSLKIAKRILLMAIKRSLSLSQEPQKLSFQLHWRNDSVELGLEQKLQEICIKLHFPKNNTIRLLQTSAWHRKLTKGIRLPSKAGLSPNFFIKRKIAVCPIAASVQPAILLKYYFVLSSHNYCKLYFFKIY